MSRSKCLAWTMVVALGAACSGTSTTESTSSKLSPTTINGTELTTPGATSTETPSSAATAAESVVELPDTPPGRQLRWVLGESATADEAAYVERFSAAFLAQVPVEALRSEIAKVGVQAVTEVLSSSDSELVVLASSGQGPLIVTITVEPDEAHRIAGLLAEPAELPDPPTSWADVEARLTKQAPQWSYMAAEVADDGSLTVLHNGGGDTPVPLGSAFKIYVLGAVVDAIRVGELSWDEELTITDELKSLPSGELQDRPSGSKVTVREAAEKMIQISDNTATDLLIDRVGRDRVEAMLVAMGMGADSRAKTLPFMTTRELFILKWGQAPEQTAAYAAAETTQRRVLLDELTDTLPTAEDFADVPEFIDSIEWFATPTEIIAAHVWLDGYRAQQGFEPLDAVLGLNPGVPLDPAVWPVTAFKGGSEPGVLFLGWLLRDASGRRVGVVLSARNDQATLDELQVVSVGSGIINLSEPT